MAVTRIRFRIRLNAVERSLSLYTRMRPITSTESFGEDIWFMPLGTCPFHSVPVMR